MKPTSLTVAAMRRIRDCGKELLLADVWYKALAFIVLTPLFSLLFRSLLAVGGDQVLSDVEIAWFLMGPWGWVCGLVTVSVWLGLIALELASLLAILAAREAGRKLETLPAIRFAWSRADRILKVTLRLVGLAWLVLAPFLLLAWGIYRWLLGEHDINFYLQDRPREFQWTVGMGVALFACAALALLRILSGWFLALPLILFEGASAASALRQGRLTRSADRQRVAIWVFGWWILGAALNALSGLLFAGAGRILLPLMARSLTMLSAGVGLLLLLLLLLTLIVNVLGTIGFALLMFHGYLEFHPDAPERIRQVSWSDVSGSTRTPWLTRRRAIAGLLIGVLLSMVVGAAAIGTLQLEDEVLVMAHRGGAALAPENTLAAMRAAIAAGADWVEIDVQETADGEVVVVHDSDLMKMARRDLKIWNATLDDLRQIDIGSSFDPRFSSERVPTLVEVLEECRGKVGVNIELKYYGHDQQLEQRVVDIVERLGMERQIMVMSLSPAGVAKIKSLRPEWRCGLLLSVAVGDVRRLRADFLAVNSRFVTDKLVSQARAMGRPVYVWTINDAAGMSSFASRGVDGLLTDRPDLARQVLRERDEMGSTQRLLLEVATLLGLDLPGRQVGETGAGQP